MDKITVEGKEYVDLDIAAEATGYERFYLRRLADAEKIDGLQIGATWLVNIDSIHEYRKAGGNRTPHKKK